MIEYNCTECKDAGEILVKVNGKTIRTDICAECCTHDDHDHGICIDCCIDRTDHYIGLTDFNDLD